MDSIEAAPFEMLSEEQASLLLQFSYSVGKFITGSTAMAIVMMIARHTVVHGESRVSHKDFQRRCGVCRRTVDNAMKQLRRHSLIERIGSTDRGAAIYRACLLPEHTHEVV